MKDLFYIDPNTQTQVGPIDISDIPSHPITATTMVWRSGMTDFQEAHTLPEISQYIEYTAPAPTIPPPPPAEDELDPQIEQADQTHCPPPIHERTNTYQPPAYEEPPTYEEPEFDKPSSYLWLSILTTAFCCLIPGIVGIVQSSKVNRLWNNGEYEAAATASRRALTWSLIGIAAGLIWSAIIYLA